MRSISLAAVLSMVSACAMAQSPPADKLSKIPEGVLTDGTYINQELGINFKLPEEWPAKLGPAMPTLFSPDQDAPANRCTRILLEYEAKPKDSTAKGVVFAIDPDCLGIGSFPAADAQRPELEAFNVKVMEIYHHSTFFPPSGAQLYAFRGSGEKSRLFLGLAGSAELQPPGTDAGVKREPVAMNTLFVVVNVDKCWVGWAIVADDKAKDEFARDSSMTVK